MTYEQATADIAVTEVGVAEATLRVNPETGELEAVTEATEEVGFITDEGTVATPADVTVH